MLLDFIGSIDLNQLPDQFSGMIRTLPHVINGTAAFIVLFLSVYIGVIPPPFDVGFIPAPAMVGLFLAGANFLIQIFMSGGGSSSKIMGDFIIDLLAVGVGMFCGSLKNELLGWLIGLLFMFLLLYSLGIPGAFERCANVCPFVVLEPYWRDVQAFVGL